MSRRPLLFVALVAACSHGDSALDRDLALAATAKPAPPTTAPLADTALVQSTAAPVRPSTPRPTMPPAAVSPSAAVTSRTPLTPTVPMTPTAAVPPAPEPVATPATAPATAPAMGAPRALAAGTTLTLTTQQAVCSRTSRPGDRFMLALRESVTSADGLSLPAGTSVALDLASITTGLANRGQVTFDARGIAVDGYFRPVAAEVAIVDTTLMMRRVPGAPGVGSAAASAGRGAMTGAILGRIFSHGVKGAIIGAAAGAATGAATSTASSRNEVNTELCLPIGSVVRMRLTGPLTI